MSKTAITAEQIRAILTQELGAIAPEADLDTLDPALDVREELDIDSFDFVRFITAVCNALQVDVPESDYIELSTLEGAEKYLINLLSAG